MVDPLNWGTVGISPVELDPDAQRHKFERYLSRNTAAEQGRTPARQTADEWSEPRESPYVREQCESYRAPSPATERISVSGESTKADHSLRKSEGEQAVKAHRTAEILSQMEALRLEFARLQLDRQGNNSEKELSIKKEEVDVALSFPPSSSTRTLLIKGESQPQASNAARYSREPDLGEAFVDHTLRASREAREDECCSDEHALRPVQQVQPQSYLGHAFRELADSSDESSSGDSSSRLRGRQRKRSKRTKGHSSLRTPTLKPRELTAYGGAADTQVFHRFIQEMTAYINGYQLLPEKHALTISWFLKGKAYQFYLNTVSVLSHSASPHLVSPSTLGRAVLLRRTRRDGEGKRRLTLPGAQILNTWAPEHYLRSLWICSLEYGDAAVLEA
ncbi:hypothetical protein NUW54_g108 [Trametes sanguinea]|uniref:Uncharacterized protein n=1 Tax=Trametes sanguinea TaxID=158606 RepID=A0ACC1QBJ2_9APHY|nr:hypothetical protein NUW54_g108 [Trametes sanguinea]